MSCAPLVIHWTLITLRSLVVPMTHYIYYITLFCALFLFVSSITMILCILVLCYINVYFFIVCQDMFLLC